MPRSTSVKQYNTFVKGLVTEANPLTFPENASLDEDNFVLKRTGSRERRLGVDYETDYTLTATGITSALIEGSRQSFHIWENPGGDTSVSIGVIRIYNKLWFVDLLTDTPSSNLLNGGNPVRIAGLNAAEIDTAVINNFLVIVSADLSRPILLEYKRDTQTVEQEEVPILVRDLWGVVDNLAVEERPTTLTSAHEYNLLNQGWSPKITSVCDVGADGFRNTYFKSVISGIVGDTRPKLEEIDPATYVAPISKAVECTFTELGWYPANSDIWTLGKVGNASSGDFQKYDPETMKKNAIDNTEAPKGGFIIDAFNRGSSRATLSGRADLLLDRETGALTTIASYAGRVFFSGVNSSVINPDSRSPNYSNYIFFSQVVTSADKISKCYQEADPTSPDISDIIDTDGGAIQIPEATRILKLVATSTSLLVFAENGIWEVFGDTNGFVATSYQVSKMASTGFSAPKTVVEAMGTVLAWTKAGIYIATQDPASGRYKVENISLLTIQSFYNGLSETTKNNALGLYDEKENVVRWLYNDKEDYSSTSYVTKYNRELILDLTLQAFYPSTISDSTPYIAAYAAIPSYTITTTDETVYSGNDIVLDTSTDTVVVSNDVFASRTTSFSFLTIVGTSFTFSKYNNRAFRDWVTYDGTGVDYSSYLLTGYDIYGDTLREKYVPYIWFYFKRTEDGYTDVTGTLELENQSGCTVQAQWDWTDSVNSGKWGNAFQAYRITRNYVPTGPADPFDYGHGVITTKNKLRGSGRSLSLYIQSQSGKDMKLLGWSVIASAGAMP